MGWFDTQIQERRACDEALMASTVEALSAAIEGKRGGEIGAQRMLPDRELEPRDIYRFVFEGLGVYDWTRVLLGAAAASLAGMVLPAATAFVFTDVIPSVMANAVDHADLGLLGPLLAILLAAGFAQAVIGALRALLMGGMVERSARDLISALMDRVLHLPASFFGAYTAGDLASRILSMRSMVELMGDALFSTGLTAVFSLAYVLQMAVLAPQLAGVACMVIALQIAGCAIVAYRTSRMLAARLDWRSQRSGREVSLVEGIQKIRLAGAEVRAFARWASLYRGELVATYGHYLDAAILAGMGAVGLLAIYALADLSAVSASAFMGFAASYGVVQAALEGLAHAACVGMTPAPFIKLVDPIMICVPETARPGQEVERLVGRIELDNVTFAYGEELEPVLKGVSVKIRPGSYVGIVGRTGCSKSTLMRVLLGFETPQAGAVYYDGRDVRQLDLRSLRRHMGVVLQDGKLFAGSLIENILVSAPDLGVEEAWRAAELAGIADDIRAMPMGMQTLVGEGASSLSGGQRQRIMIARAIAASPRVLLFDEATSALDNATQAHVAASLASLKCTRIAIAHRLSTVRDCDRILVFDDGRIVEDGTYEELVAADGVFADLVRRQQA